MKNLNINPQQVGFHVANVNMNPNGSAVKAVFTTIQVLFGKWDSTTSEYVIPQQGWWVFKSLIGFNSLPTSSRISSNVYVNGGTGGNYRVLSGHYPVGNSSADYRLPGSTILPLKKDDRVAYWIYCNSSCLTRAYDTDSWFTGLYLGPL